jgi:hypothetical protein
MQGALGLIILMNFLRSYLPSLFNLETNRKVVLLLETATIDLESDRNTTYKNCIKALITDEYLDEVRHRYVIQAYGIADDENK